VGKVRATFCKPSRKPTSRTTAEESSCSRIIAPVSEVDAAQYKVLFRLVVWYFVGYKIPKQKFTASFKTEMISKNHSKKSELLMQLIRLIWLI
jgi:hypothetical protein